MSDISERVKKHKRKRLKENYKNISFMVSPEEFKLIQKARKERKMSTRELLIYFISGQYIKDVFDMEYYNEYNDLRLDTDQYMKKEHDDFGNAHKFKNKKDYVLVAYISVDRKKIKFIKDFDTYDEITEYAKTLRTKRRLAIYRKDEYSKDGWYGFRDQM